MICLCCPAPGRDYIAQILSGAVDCEQHAPTSAKFVLLSHQLVCSNHIGRCAVEAHSISGAQQDAVPAGAKKKAEQAPGQPPVTQSRATSQDVALAGGAAADVTPTASSKQSELADASKAVSDNGAAEQKGAPVDAKLETVDAASAPQQDLQPSQAVEPMQTDLAAPAAAPGVTAASTAEHAAALGSKAGPPPAETEAVIQSLPALAPASDSTAVAELPVLQSDTSPDAQLVDSKQAALSKVPEADSSSKQGGDTTQPKAEHVNGNSNERPEQEEKHRRPAENGALPEEEAGAPVRPLRPAAKRTRRG